MYDYETVRLETGETSQVTWTHNHQNLHVKGVCGGQQTVDCCLWSSVAQCGRRLDLTEAWMVSVIEKLASEFVFVQHLGWGLHKKCGKPDFRDFTST
jgi:hypothetical protein